MLFNVEKMEEVKKNELKRFAKSMPNGEFLNHHNGEIDSCEIIVMLNSGDICPLYNNCSLNPLKKDKDGNVCLSTFSCGGNFKKDSSDWEEAIKIHNESILNTALKYNFSFGVNKNLIVAYYKF